MIDVHCHILPEVDDGAKSWDIALEMCHIAAQDGITHIVATPHANYEYEYDREAHQQRLLRLRELAPTSLEFSLGCDFHFSYDNIEDALKHPHRYAIAGGQYMLIELSDYSIPFTISETMSRLNGAGLKLILTHPERNAILQRRPEQVLAWAEKGCAVQVTASSITGFWGKAAKNVSKWLLERRAVHIIASDGHDTKHRPPKMSEARKVVAEWADQETARMLFEENPRAIVCSEPLPYFPQPDQ
ncbi:MAG TPA: CpsB/CapC family capsule biosynthesis tyrosine phosphatase [Terriglobales bacterium]|nr:CpsB/CapC family capsule biosynthesis tyrosine phosphatase [Terriglobales bacterium]